MSKLSNITPSRRSVLKGLGAATAAAAVAPAVKATAGEKVELKIMLTNIPWTDAILTTIAEAYSAHTGGRVTITGEQMPYEGITRRSFWNSVPARPPTIS